MRELFRLWPTDKDLQGCDQLKKYAWVEGLDARLFVGRPVLVHRESYDGYHVLALHAAIAQRTVVEEQPQPNTRPPFRLTYSWTWAVGASSGGPTAIRPLIEKAGKQDVDRPSSVIEAAWPCRCSASTLLSQTLHGPSMPSAPNACEAMANRAPSRSSCHQASSQPERTVSSR